LKRLVKTISEKEKIEFDFNFEWNNKKLENVKMNLSLNLYLLFDINLKASDNNVQSIDNKDAGNILGTNKDKKLK
jgi:hypothetical protein